MESRQYRKKPVVIEAVIWTGANLEEIAAFVGSNGSLRDFTLVIKTLEGEHVASDGDFIIKGVKGEFYPCKPDIFAMTYEPVAAGGNTFEAKLDAVREIVCAEADNTSLLDKLREIVK